MSTAAPKAKPPHRDAIREIVETIVFVVALVLMLKLFVVEAFVIPTGSMAETLLGYNKVTTCPDCEFVFPVNASNEVDPQDGGRPRPITGTTCPNCRRKLYYAEALDLMLAGVRREDREAALNRLKQDLVEEVPAKNADIRSGDRVLVLKPLYSVGPPEPGDVVVFKYPVDPQIKHTAQNYIKRLWGRGEDTIGIRGGDLYVARGIDYPRDELETGGRHRYPRPDDPLRLWEGPHVFGHTKTGYQSLGNDFTYHNTNVALAAFERSRLAGFPGGNGTFGLLRKSDGLALSMRRIVFNNDHQSKLLAKKGVPRRWTIDSVEWKADSNDAPKTFGHSGDTFGWIRYRNRLPAPMEMNENGTLRDDWMRLEAEGYREGMFAPSQITNYLGYNAGAEEGIQHRETGQYWVGDLMLECTAKLSGPADEVVLEVSKGVNRFQAKFTGGNVTLTRTGPQGKEMVTRPTGITSGTHDLRFANFDCRLRVWVDGKTIDFGDEGDYSPSDAAGFEAALGGIVGCALAPRADGHTVQNDIDGPASLGAKGSVELSKIVIWQDTYFTPASNEIYANPADPVDTFYVQPGHYLCLGDNSGQSSDSRKWGLVPERLMLGRAVFVFWPFSFSYNRVGFIR